MLEKLHDHLIAELQQTARTDTVFVVSAVLFDLVALAINAAMASGKGVAGTLVFVVFLLITLCVNLCALVALTVGGDTRQRLLGGLAQLYQDQNIGKYY